VAQVAKPVPGESKTAPIVYHGPVEPKAAPAVGQGFAESVIEDDVDGLKNGGAVEAPESAGRFYGGDSDSVVLAYHSRERLALTSLLTSETSLL
jgi:hypothetical protein